MTYHIFIGYDEREHEPFLVAKHSLEKRATVPVKVHKLHHRELRSAGLFTREWEIKANGQYVDKVDGKPFSTQFSHSRFLLPTLWKNLPDPTKSPLVMFVDCDFAWMEDIGEMFSEIERKKIQSHIKHPIYCVKHDYQPQSQFKMDNCEQHAYNMKLWSAMFVFDMEHKDNDKLTPDIVNTETGRFLHNFGWVEDVNTIEGISHKWQYIPNHSEKYSKDIGCVHWTEGGAWFPNYRNCKFADFWWDELNDYYSSKIKSSRFDVQGIVDGT
jgi:hypothetical protein